MGCLTHENGLFHVVGLGEGYGKISQNRYMAVNLGFLVEARRDISKEYCKQESTVNSP
jgi:hypothetical protein